MSRPSATSLGGLMAVIAIVTLTVATSSVALADTATWTYYKDKFQERDYDGNDATGEFSTDWIEVGEANGPTKGYVTVSGHDYCFGDYCLQIGDGALAVGNVGIERSLNLEGALEARLTFIYATDLFGGSLDEEVALQISKDAGRHFTTLETYLLDKDMEMTRQRYINISEWAAPQTVIRFVSLNGAPKNVLLVDSLWIKGKFIGDPPPATTTTTTTSTTTTSTTTTSTTSTSTTTTTTTLPPTTTTTTTTAPPATTTTTKPPGSTTSAPSTTTTLPSSTTTTTTPAVASAVVLPPPGSDESFRTKDALVVRDVARSEVPGVRTSSNEPVSLVVSFRTTAEAFTYGALPSTILGVLIAVLAVVGLSRGMKPDTQ